jgi:AraC-like DNA-binding protein
VGTAEEASNRRLLRSRDAIDRSFAEPLDIPTLASIACLSPSAYIRSFKAAFGDTPHRYLQRRRIERAMYLLRATDQPIGDVCFQVGFGSIGTFGRTFQAIVGESPTEYRGRGAVPDVPTVFVKRWMRPSSFGEAS